MTEALDIRMTPISEIHPYKGNVKIHSEEQIEQIANQIEKFGWDQPIVVDKDGEIIKGHGRRLACIARGWTEAPVWHRDNLSKSQANAARIADNKIASNAEYDEELMRKQLDALVESAEDFTAMDLGFSEEEIVLTLSDDASDLDGLLTDDLSASEEAESKSEKTDVAHEPKGVDYTPTFQVLVQCSDEADQEKVYNMLSAEGYKVKIQSM